MTAALAVPAITPDHATLAAALAYAASGWYLGPLRVGSKDPGSVLGKGWQLKTSRDPDVLAMWFAGTDHGVFLHAGRSGAVVFDVDHPERLAQPIRQAIDQYPPPFQSTRPHQLGRGHYIFRVPDGRRLGNSLGDLANGWGQVRGVNGAVVVAPSTHADHAEGGLYCWLSTGPVPELPGYLATQLPDAMEASEAATDADVAAFLAKHSSPTEPRPELLEIHAHGFQKAVANGESRHGTMTGRISGAMKQAAAGLLDAKAAADTLESVFLEAVAQPPSGKQGAARTGAIAANEWRGLLAWAVGQARTADPQATRARVNEKVPPQVIETDVAAFGVETNTDLDSLGIDPELIKELDAKSKEIIAEAVADGTLGAVLDPDQIFPPPGNPMGVARKLLKDWTHNGLTTLQHWRGSWMQWQFTHWSEVDEATIRAKAYARLEKAVYLANLKPTKTQESTDEAQDSTDRALRGMAIPWLPNRRRVGDVLEALKGCVHLPESVDTPTWLPGAPMRGGAHLWPAERTVSCTNGLLDVTSRELVDLTAGFFNRVAVPFNYDPDAPAPTRWLEFLNQLWPDDPDSIAALREWFGYVLSGRTDMHKIFLIIGPTRSGKGTIARVLEALIGKANVAAPTLASLGQNFGLAPLLGKPLAVIGDARLSGSNVHQVIERLLSISGEDSITIDRKFRDQWTGRLPTRLLLISNELPRFGDASGAIAHRFIMVMLQESFLGRENFQLTEQLLAELPGILNWALEGLDRIGRQPFTVPGASDDAIVQLMDLVSPTSAFVRDRCVRRKDKSIRVQWLFDDWRRWCDDNGHRPGSVQTFGRDLRAVIPELRTFKPHDQPREYAGLELKESASTAHSGPERGSSGSNPTSNGSSDT